MAVRNGESDENYPLLFLYLEDAKTGNKGYRRMFGSKNRSSDINTGATAVITQWPGHLASCWFAALICGLVLLVLTIILFAAASGRPHYPSNHRCTGTKIFKEDIRLDNGTIHIVHSTYSWSRPQLDTLFDVITSFKNNKVHLVVIVESKTTTEMPGRNEVVGTSEKMVVVGKRVKKDVVDGGKGKTGILKVLIKSRNKRFTTKKKATDIHQLLKNYPEVIFDVLTYEEVFTNTPLDDVWRNLKEENRIFAARALYLWQFGGLSYALPELTNPTQTDVKQKIGKLISTGDASFKNLPKGIVTIDDEGLHMQTKTTCHAFFGEIISKLRVANNEKVEDIIRDTLEVFCKRGAVDSGYCANIKS